MNIFHAEGLQYFTSVLVSKYFFIGFCFLRYLEGNKVFVTKKSEMCIYVYVCVYAAPRGFAHTEGALQSP